MAAAGHAIGQHCSAQANMMARGTVWQAMVAAFKRASGDLAERLLAAMQAAEREGGDMRGRQAAALIVVSGQPSGVPSGNRLFDLRVDDPPDPVGEIARLLPYSRAHQRANWSFEKFSVGDLSGALEDICGAAYPNEPEFLIRRALILMAFRCVDEAREMVRRAHSIHAGWAEFVLRLADARIIPIPREAVERLVAGLG